MTSIRTIGLLALATLPGGVLAGVDLDRTLVAMPAWSKVGALGWAAFSRHADLGPGLVLYPVEALTGATLALAAAVSHRLDRGSLRVGLPLYAAVALTVLGLALTVKAAPIMLSTRDMSDPMLLRGAFDAFRHWGDLRGACQISAFVAELWALAAIGWAQVRTGASSPGPAARRRRR